MARLIRDVADDGDVGVKAHVLRSICAMIESLADEVDRGCGGTCMASPVDGVRIWASQARLDVEMARTARLEVERTALIGERDMLRIALARIAEPEAAAAPFDETDAGSGDWLAGLLGDPDAQTRRLRTLAADALRDSPPMRH
jgi:hypothetical protein